MARDGIDEKIRLIVADLKFEFIKRIDYHEYNFLQTKIAAEQINSINLEFSKTFFFK